jgi:hypothetical protein
MKKLTLILTCLLALQPALIGAQQPPEKKAKTLWQRISKNGRIICGVFGLGIFTYALYAWNKKTTNPPTQPPLTLDEQIEKENENNAALAKKLAEFDKNNGTHENDDGVITAPDGTAQNILKQRERIAKAKDESASRIHNLYIRKAQADVAQRTQEFLQATKRRIAARQLYASSNGLNYTEQGYNEAKADAEQAILKEEQAREHLKLAQEALANLTDDKAEFDQ